MYSFMRVELISTGHTKEDHGSTKQHAPCRRAMTSDNEMFREL